MWLAPRSPLALLTTLSLSPLLPRRPASIAMVADGRLTARIKRTEDTLSLLHIEQKHGDDFNQVHLGATWGQLGKLARSCAADADWLRAHPEALEPLNTRTVGLLGTCSPRTLANVAHGMAAAAPADSEAWRVLTRCVTPAALGKMKPMELTSLAHAGALMERDAPTLFAACAVEALPRLADFSAQELAGLAWAFARADRQAAPGGQAAGAPSAAPPVLLRARGRDIVREAAAREVRRAVTVSLFEGIAAEARRKRDKITPREVSTLCWAFGRLRVGAPELLDVLCARCAG